MRKPDDKLTNMTRIPPSKTDGYYFDSDFSNRMEEKYRAMIYRTVLADVGYIQHDLMRVFGIACFYFEEYEQERKHWIIQFILAMCQELRQLEDYQSIEDAVAAAVPLRTALSSDEHEALAKQQHLFCY